MRASFQPVEVILSKSGHRRARTLEDSCPVPRRRITKPIRPQALPGIYPQGVHVNLIYLASNLLALANNALVFGANLNNLGSARI